MLKEQIQSLVEEVVRELDLQPPQSIQIEMPRDRSHGDFSTNVALILAREARMSPRDLAERICSRLRGHRELVADVEIAGPGFINFRLGAARTAEVLRELLRAGEHWGRSTLGKGVRIQIEYVSANPTGPLNVVSARAAAYGSTLAAILRACGYEVEGEFYVNDAGRQIEMLGASLRARWMESRGRAASVPEDGYHGDYVRDLAAELDPQEASEWDGLPDPESHRKFGAFGVEHMLMRQRADLERFGVTYDRWFRESELHERDDLPETLRLLDESGATYTKDSALYFRSTDWEDDKDRVLLRSDGTPTYFLGDAAYHRDKYKRGFRHVIDVWGPDHHGHIVRMQALARALGYPEDWLEVVIVQWVKLVEGGQAIKMSKRAGTLVTLASLLDEVDADVAKYFFLMRQQNAHLDFDLDLAREQSDENPVYYVKYAHARICSVIRKAAEAGLELRADDLESVGTSSGQAAIALEHAPVQRLEQPEELELIRLLLDYGPFLQRAALAREPHRLTGYCEDLARAFHKFYHEHRVIQEDQELALARLALCHATRRVLASALGLMSIDAPQSM